MALTAVRPAMNHDDQNLHPFFSKPQRDVSQTSSSTIIPVDRATDGPDYEEALADGSIDKSRKKRARKPERKAVSSVVRNQASLDSFTSRPKTQDVGENAHGDTLDPSLEQDPNQDRRKRRKTEFPEPSGSAQDTTKIEPHTLHSEIAQLEGRAEQNDVCNKQPDQAHNGNNVLVQPTTSSEVPNSIAAPGESLPDKKITPTKIIKITKTGKLLSSPPKSTTLESTTPKKRRGRKPKQNTFPTVTVIKYGSDPAHRSSIGQKIEAILNGPKSMPRRPTTPKKSSGKPIQPPKVTHPFFLGKATPMPDEPTPQNAPDQRPQTPRKSAVTPGKLRAEARRDRPPGPVPSFGNSLGQKKPANQAGLYEASWPTQETCHVRNLETISGPVVHPGGVAELPLRPRKWKRRVITLQDEEELITKLATNLARQRRLDANQTKSDFAPPEHVRLPTRLLTTGNEIQRRVREHIKPQIISCREYHNNNATAHLAIEELFNNIEHTLTPFDEGRCENQAWVHKYSPKSAAHVLQRGKEAFVLKDWLQGLTVMSVGGAQSSSRLDSLETRRPPKKKRKKAFDDFIVSDDDEQDDEMIQCSDNENTPSFGSRSFRTPKWTRNKNVILISGPQGCGKSATVYAVARELGFEVFEINSGTRRSGKDIQDKVGDMTANHLVNHKRSEVPPKDAVADENADIERMSTSVQDDIDSGRQGTMMSFFKANPNAPPKPTSKVKPEVKQTAKAPAQAMLPITTTSKKSQKQSLILLEEADILFEEDQQFWAQVTKLAAQSKRPIVITCNDERQIPVHDLPLAAMLRLRPAPIDLATDYMLVLAGREGHILEREAVADLYMSKDCDLRASISELDFWCQMSVGDRKGGLEWMYQRWPPGKDTDAQGRPLRVASEGTYQSGMGFLSHNVFETSENSTFDREEELLSEVWNDWGIGPHNWSSSSGATLTAPKSPLEVLEELDTYMDALSSADIYCRVDLPSYNRDFDQPTDPSEPTMTNKTRLNYTLAAPVLQVDHRRDLSGFDAAMYIQTLLLAGRACDDASHLAQSRKAPGPVTEVQYANAILKSKADKATKSILTRLDFSMAFDILAAPPDYTLLERTSFNLTPSSFDRNFRIITQDLAPYVRSIVAHEQILEEQRLRLANLLSEGGKGKRPRTTRASRVALEGGVRETKRRDRWFDKDLDFGQVMATAGRAWAGLGWKGEGQDIDEGTGSMTGTQDSVEGVQDFIMYGTQDGQGVP